MVKGKPLYEKIITITSEGKILCIPPDNLHGKEVLLTIQPTEPVPIKLDEGIAVTVAGILATFAALLIPFVNVPGSDNPSLIWGSTISFVIGIVCILGSALIIDEILDDKGLNLFDRCRVARYGYLIYSATVALITFALLAAFFAATHEGASPVENIWLLVLYVACSFFVFGKIMTDEDFHFYTIASCLSLLMAFILTSIL